MIQLSTTWQRKWREIERRHYCGTDERKTKGVVPSRQSHPLVFTQDSSYSSSVLASNHPHLVVTRKQSKKILPVWWCNGACFLGNLQISTILSSIFFLDDILQYSTRILHCSYLLLTPYSSSHWLRHRIKFFIQYKSRAYLSLLLVCILHLALANHWLSPNNVWQVRPHPGLVEGLRPKHSLANVS